LVAGSGDDSPGSVAVTRTVPPSTAASAASIASRLVDSGPVKLHVNSRSAGVRRAASLGVAVTVGKPRGPIGSWRTARPSSAVCRWVRHTKAKAP
jgi:hypothetical protein